MQSEEAQKINALMERIVEVRYSDLEQERTCCEELLEVAEREKNIFATAFSHTYLGDYYIAQNDTAQCITHLQRAQMLCTKHGISGLLALIYNLFGVCYEAVLDEQTALQNYLNAMQHMQEHADAFLECAVLNNIASNLDIYGDYEEATKYYERACEALEKLPPDTPNLNYLKLRLWTNIADVLRAVGKYEKMKEYLLLCKRECDDDTAKRYLMNHGWCGYYAGLGRAEQAAEYAQRLLLLLGEEPYLDKYFIYELLDGIFRDTMGQKSYGLAKRTMEYLQTMCGPEETGRLRKNQQLLVQYCEATGTHSERMNAYEKYYHIMVEAEKGIRRTKANGLKNILYLDGIKNALTLEKLNLVEAAHLDELTQLYNRRYFNKLLSKESTNPETHSAALVMIDVDYFKEYNDTYGHARGDDALRAVAQVLKAAETQQIYVARYGGDEFVLLYTNPERGALRALTDKIREALAEKAIEHKASCCARVLTLTMGAARGVAADLQKTLLDKADTELYTAKENGRNAVSFRDGED